MLPDLAAALASGATVLADGAMGTVLQAEGLPPGSCGEAWNLDRPDTISGIHATYAAAGARILLTNTFGGTRLRLAFHGEEHRTAEINAAAVSLARKGAGPGAWVLGDLGPFGGILAPLGDADPAEVRAAYIEQARTLIEAGADGLIIETQTALDELEIALRAAREAGARFVAASVAFDRTKSGAFRTMMGVAPEAAARTMLEAGADVLGCNCGKDVGVAEAAAILRIYRTVTDRPLLARPNAGQPAIAPSGIVYPERPEAMAAQIPLLRDAGAAIIGGCCGTTPRHIALFREALAGG